MRVVLLLLVSLVMVQGCSGGESPPLKSPCVGAEDSPCGPRRAVNDPWMFS